MTSETHHPAGGADMCNKCGQHVDARVHHTPERVAGEVGPAIGARMLVNPVEEAANLIAAAITPSGYGWAYVARFTQEAVRDLIAAGWTPPARAAGDEEAKLRAELEAAYRRIEDDNRQLHRVMGENFALTAFRDALVHDAFEFAGRGETEAALIKAGTEKRYTRQEVADLLKKLLNRCDRAKGSAQKQRDQQAAAWEETVQRKQVALAEHHASAE